MTFLPGEMCEYCGMTTKMSVILGGYCCPSPHRCTVSLNVPDDEDADLGDIPTNVAEEAMDETSRPMTDEERKAMEESTRQLDADIARELNK